MLWSQVDDVDIFWHVVIRLLQVDEKILETNIKTDKYEGLSESS